ncbi:MAG TPA: type I methionyl aminopeptidase [Mycobacteriales bacterium]|jgi:methionyl aminopeptidase|nr:type I methionyl aminopeptidase [Mycobacteriales bacterium]
MIQIKSRDEIALMRQAGIVVGTTLATLRDSVKPGMSTADLDEIARDCLAKAGATSNFLGYHGFPATVCTSVNDQIVHGIPSKKAVLADGDIVSIDFGAIIEGYHGDAAITVAVGEVTHAELELLRVTEESLWHGMASGLLGARLVDVSRAIEDYIRSQPHPSGGSWGIVEEYVGHGIGTEMHQDPQVHNFVGPRMGKGPELVEGLALAVEPMVNLGSRMTKVLDDGWTVVTSDGSRSAHFEHSFTMTEEGPWVLTAIDGGRDRIAAISELASSSK